MFRSIFSNNVGKRFFSSIARDQMVKPLDQQFSEKMKDPVFLEIFNEIQEKIKIIKLKSGKYPSVETSESKANREAAETEERNSRKHSLY